MHLLAVVLAAVSTAASAKISWRDLSESYSFEAFMNDFKPPYDADDNRRKLFTDELRRVIAHNKKNLSWKEGINKFSAMTKEEKKASFGRSKGAAYQSKNKLKHERTLPFDGKLETKHLPKSVDWREKGIVSTVKDQGHCGSCWAFAATATIESYVALNSGLLFSLSPEQIAMCAPNPDKCGGVGKCEGSTAELAFEYLSNSAGIYQEFQYPYVSYSGTDYACNTDTVAAMTSPKATINGFVQLKENSYTDVMNAIATKGPLAINVDASTWHAYEEGIYNGCNQESPDVNHVVVLVGYGEEKNGEKYWLVRNSWSASFGEAGYIKLLRQDGADEQVCGKDITPQDGTQCENGPEEVTVCGTCGAIYDASYPLMADIL